MSAGACPIIEAVPALVADATGRVEIEIPDWGAVGEISRDGTIDSIGADGGSPPLGYKAVEYALDTALRRCGTRPPAGRHVDHWIAKLLASVAYSGDRDIGRAAFVAVMATRSARAAT